MMEVEKATAGRMIDRLVANGWVERRSEPGDKRVKRVYLTVEAERVHKRIWRIAEETVETALADLSARESKQLFALLQRVKETLVSGADVPAKGAAGRHSASRAPRRPNGNGRIAP
jgi:DNA-binding MarR family transcriptional regulator